MKSKLNILFLGLFFQVYFSSCTLEKRLHNSGLHVQVNAFQRQGLREPAIKKSKFERAKLNPETKHTLTTNVESNTFSEMSNTEVEQHSILGIGSLTSRIKNKQKLRKENQLAIQENSLVFHTEKANNNSLIISENIKFQAESNSKINPASEFEPYSSLSILGFIGIVLLSILLDSVVIFIFGAIALIVLSVIGLYRLIESPSQWKLKFFSYLFAILGIFFGVMALLLSGFWGCC